MSADSVPSSKTNIFFKTNYTLIYCRHFRTYSRCAMLIEVIRSSGEEMWRVDAYQIPYYSRGIEEAKRTHPRFADCLGDISCVCLACLVQQNLKQSTTTRVLHWKKKKIQCGCTCVYDLLIAFSKFLTERHVHIRQQSESVGLSCPNLNLSILHI